MIDKMVEDAKQSPHARGAFIFYLQNIANLVRTTPDKRTAAELADAIHARAEDMADVVFRHHAAIAPTAPVAPVAEESQEQADRQPAESMISGGTAVPVNPPLEGEPGWVGSESVDSDPAFSSGSSSQPL